MAERDWKSEYRRSVERQPTAKDIAESEAEQRAHPRMAPVGLSVEIGVTPGLHLIDIDPRSVTLYSETELPPGAQFTLQIDTAPSIAVQVVDCVAEEVDSIWMEMRYRIRCLILPTPPQR